MTKASKTIRKEMIIWGAIGLSAGILSQYTGYAFSTCRKEIAKVKSEGWTEKNWNGDVCLKNICDFEGDLS